jgi:hypothetical protein
LEGQQRCAHLFSTRFFHLVRTLNANQLIGAPGDCVAEFSSNTAESMSAHESRLSKVSQYEANLVNAGSKAKGKTAARKQKNSGPRLMEYRSSSDGKMESHGA